MKLRTLVSNNFAAVEQKTNRAVLGLGDEIDTIAKSYALYFLAENQGTSEAEIQAFIERRSVQINLDLAVALTRCFEQAGIDPLKWLDELAGIILLLKEAVFEHIMYQIEWACE